MLVSVLGSGSRGNAVAVTAGGFSVLIDAGFSPRTLRRRAQGLGVELGAIAGVVLTHEHVDHARGSRAFSRLSGCGVYGSAGTLGRLGIDGRVLGQLEPVTIGPFTVTAVRTTHDAAEPIALSVVGPDGEKLGIAYDLGEAGGVLRYLLRAAECLIVESNHDDLMLVQGPYPPTVRYRIAGRHGHLSNRAAAELLAELCHPGLATVILAHLSEECNRPDLAAAATGAALASRGFGGRLLLATQDAPLGPIPVRAHAA